MNNNMGFIIAGSEGKMGILLPRCRICNQVPQEGIRGGIKLKRAFICNQCEQDIINVDVGSEQYEILLQKIKSILK